MLAKWTKEVNLVIKNSRGLTLVELLVALAILSIIVVAYLSLFTISYQGIFHSGHKSNALFEGQEVIDKIIRNPNYTAPGVTKTDHPISNPIKIPLSALSGTESITLEALGTKVDISKEYLDDQQVNITVFVPSH
ncbi:prepilin-type N-terminal cleavage/methylation domain-containing protein [Heliorestis acidaminivorans]|uniref:Prepilin-type N-terminal cleavage/methylation domain-containing protein n=1 Tax=Heliorestis acidaminivorans TaxID=553427 RepID=A0A6I0EYC8_9FIRM|nr:prepilin-type N-terminal cleavage/methylation domain-containing protein [Heliorestis acidaminivorans]KAB2951655.1 prepilin-type N-terminal cleavage/methylation domain-containing protein [Heliorestis acidaminivorans]